ncbi:MAG: AIR synthase-related protein, partial [Novosphingobium sp.]
DYPIVSGNVSLYNASKATGGGSALLPNPALGGVGVMVDHAVMATIAFKDEGDAIWLVGDHGKHLGQSLWLREVAGREDGDAPAVALAVERAHGDRVRAFVQLQSVNAVHDISDGGLLVALAEMALASGKGCSLSVSLDTAAAFGEDQGRYIVTASSGTSIDGAELIGTVGGTTVAGVELSALREASDSFFRDWMEG